MHLDRRWYQDLIPSSTAGSSALSRAQPSWCSPRQGPGTASERARARDYFQQTACVVSPVWMARGLNAADVRSSSGPHSSPERASLAFTVIHSQEARLSFGSRRAGHASSRSARLGLCRARTCTTLHAPGCQAALVRGKAHPRRLPKVALHGTTSPDHALLLQTGTDTAKDMGQRRSVHSGMDRSTSSITSHFIFSV